MKNKILMMAGIVGLAGATIITNVLLVTKKKKVDEIEEKEVEQNVQEETIKTETEDVNETETEEEITPIDDSDIDVDA